MIYPVLPERILKYDPGLNQGDLTRALLIANSPRFQELVIANITATRMAISLSSPRGKGTYEDGLRLNIATRETDRLLLDEFDIGHDARLAAFLAVSSIIPDKSQDFRDLPLFNQ